MMSARPNHRGWIEIFVSLSACQSMLRVASQSKATDKAIRIYGQSFFKICFKETASFILGNRAPIATVVKIKA